MNYLTFFKSKLDSIFSRLRKIEKSLCENSFSGNKNYLINSTSNTLNESLPLLGWTQPVGAKEGDTATVNFNYNTQGHYTYQGGQWVFNFKTGFGYNYVSGWVFVDSKTGFLMTTNFYHNDFPLISFDVDVGYTTDQNLRISINGITTNYDKILL